MYDQDLNKIAVGERLRTRDPPSPQATGALKCRPPEGGPPAFGVPLPHTGCTKTSSLKETRPPRSPKGGEVSAQSGWILTNI